MDLQNQSSSPLGKKAECIGINMYKAQRIILAAFGIAMVILLTLDGMGRYILGRSIPFAQELTRIMFVWGCFISITTAFLKRAHIGFNVLAEKNAFSRKASSILNGVTLSLVGAVVMYYGGAFTLRVGRFPLPASGLPIYVLYIAGVLAGATWIAIGLYQSFTAIKK